MTPEQRSRALDAVNHLEYLAEQHFGAAAMGSAAIIREALNASNIALFEAKRAEDEAWRIYVHRSEGISASAIEAAYDKALDATRVREALEDQP